MSYRCLVCAYDQMPHPPSGYNICPCCGIEYGLDDAFESYEELRNDWLLAGGPWFSEVAPYLRPANWNAWDQLALAGYRHSVPRLPSAVKTEWAVAKIPDGFELVEILRNLPEWLEA